MSVLFTSFINNVLNKCFVLFTVPILNYFNVEKATMSTPSTPEVGGSEAAQPNLLSDADIVKNFASADFPTRSKALSDLIS